MVREISTSKQMIGGTYYEDKTSNSQLCNGFMTKLTNGYSDFDKEMLKDTMLEHEAIFRQQVFELHRVYQLQRDMMKQYQSKEAYAYPMLMDTSQTNSPSQMPQNDGKMTWQMPVPPSSTIYRKDDTNQTSMKFLREGSVQSSPNGFPSSDLAPKSKQHTFDLQLPADHYVDDDNVPENNPIDFLGLTSDTKQQNGADLTLVNAEYLGRLSDNSSTSGLRATNNLGGKQVADLNEPTTGIDMGRVNGSVSRGLSHTLENRWHQLIVRSDTTNFNFNKEYTKDIHSDKGASSNFFDASGKIRQDEKPLINKGKQVSGINFLAPRYNETDPQKYFRVSDGRAVNNNQFVYHSQSSSGGWFARNSLESYAANNFARFDHPHHTSMGTLAAPISIPPLDYPSVTAAMDIVDPRSSVIGNTAFIPRFNGSSAVNSYTSFSAVTQSIGSSTPKLKYANNSDRHYPGFPLDSFSACPSRHQVAISNDMEHKSTQRFEHSAQQSHGKGIKSFNLNETLSDDQEDGLVEQDVRCIGSLQHDKNDTLFGISWLKNKATYADPTGLEKSTKVFGHSFGFEMEPKNNEYRNEAALTIRNLSDSASTSLQCGIKKDGSSEDIAARNQLICNKTHEHLPLPCQKHVPKDGQAAEAVIKKNPTSIRNFIDLNDDVPNEDNSEESVVSHECQVASLQNNQSKRAFVIDLEVPACEEGSAWAIHQECTHPVARDTHLELDESSVTSAIAAAESIIALSMDVPATVEEPDDMLQWFAGLTVSNFDDRTGQVETCINDSSDDELDSFELLTLQLEETKIDEYWSRPVAPPISTDEQTVSTAHLLTKPRRGQQRRRRQKRDFQKDILPGLSSLSRPEIIEDVQLLEGLVVASGGSWESSLTRRGRYGGRTRGRKPLKNVTVAVEEDVQVVAPLKPPGTGDLEADDKGMFGWGRTTRRCRRTRCPSVDTDLKANFCWAEPSLQAPRPTMQGVFSFQSRPLSASFHSAGQHRGKHRAPLSMARRSLTGDAIAGAVSRVRFAPSSNNLLASWDSGLRLYDADASKLQFTAESKVPFLDCCFEDEAAGLACCSYGSVRRYDFHSGAHDTVGLHEDAVTCIEFSQMTGQVVTGSFDKKLQFWDRKIGRVNPIGTVSLESHVSSLSICGMYLLAAVARNVYFYDIRNLSGPVKAKDCPLQYHIQCMQASPEWNGYVAGSVDGIVSVKYFNRGTDCDIGYAFRCHPNSRDGKSDRVSVNCVAIHPCMKTFVTGDDKGHAISWDAQSKKKLVELPRYSGSLSSMAYNHNGQLLAVAPTYYNEDKVLEKYQILIETVDYKGKPHLG